MAAFGNARFAETVEVLIAERDRSKVLGALRAAGYDVGVAAALVHYFVMLPEHGGDPNVRLDLLFPAGEPELSAIEHAARVPIVRGGDVFNVIQPDLLAMMMFYLDLRAMYDRGVFAPNAVRQMIGSVDSESGAGASALD